MNLPKLVPEDVPLFLALVRDLFPGLECPRVGYPDFSAAVEAALAEQDYVVLPAQVSFRLVSTYRMFSGERMKHPSFGGST
jgi:dynein heavy chain